MSPRSIETPGGDWLRIALILMAALHGATHQIGEQFADIVIHAWVRLGDGSVPNRSNMNNGMGMNIPLLLAEFLAFSLHFRLRSMMSMWR
jgi:hypothetical protein